MIKVLFFAQTRELVECDSLVVDHAFATVEALRQHLAQQPGKWDMALEPGKLWRPLINRLCHSIQS